MAQYIDKSTLVEEIENLLKPVRQRLERDKNDLWDSDIAVYKFGKQLIKNIDTLEVKGVDLEKELDEWIKYGPHTNYPWCTILDAIKITAEHFFELGMSISNKAQKGELYDCK